MKNFPHLKSLLFRSFLRSPGRPAFWIRRNGNTDLSSMVSVASLSGCWKTPEPLKELMSTDALSLLSRGREAAAFLNTPNLWAPWLKHWELLLGEPEGSRKWWCEFTSVSSPWNTLGLQKKRQRTWQINGTKFKIQRHHVWVRFSGLWSLC